MNPLSNLNAISSSAGASADNRQAPGNNVWSNNVYSGSWGWYAYLYGTCDPLPVDPVTSKSLPAGACGVLDVSAWNSYWQQDSSAAHSARPGA
jgi:hypothetical protein